jgi:hypothetical protein
VVFDRLSHAGLHEDPKSFNRATLDFLLRQSLCPHGAIAVDDEIARTMGGRAAVPRGGRRLRGLRSRRGAGARTGTFYRNSLRRINGRV